MFSPMISTNSLIAAMRNTFIQFNLSRQAAVLRERQELIAAIEPVSKKANWHPVMTADDVFAAPLTGISRVSFVTESRKSNEFALDGSNREHMLQTGRALAQLPYWTLADNVQPPAFSSVSTSRMLRAYVLRHVSGRLIAACIVMNASNHIVAECYEMIDGQWKYHAITHVSRRACFLANVSGQYTIAYTKYHVLAKILRGDKVFVVGDKEDALTDIGDGFQREMWSKVAGFDYREFPVVVL